ncbi:RNAse E [Dongia mobilis]|uniref:Ribonuclease E n=1 Tax=Dongia mobilis TaxID=578943 RepID=A0A4R6WQU7_9PROT|nr:ribonuclease E/G [Dongia mobilis]TDQ83935.1 RNAse E [Dongia mobilis]
MTKTMLIDATHPEETRVAVVDGRKLEEFDVEVASRHPLKGNIYLAKVTRVEPSLQAAFVEYGGNRHGFLAFSEIHPDYYRIPVADREALLREEIEEAEAEEVETEAPDVEVPEDGKDHGEDAGQPWPRDPGSHPDSEPGTDAEAAPAPGSDEVPDVAPDQATSAETWPVLPAESWPAHPAVPAAYPTQSAAGEATVATGDAADADADAGAPAQGPSVMPLAVHHDTLQSAPVASETNTEEAPETPADLAGDGELPPVARGDIVEVTQPPEVIDTVGGEAPPAEEEDDDAEEDDDSARRRRQRHLRRYKIQEVIKRRQILLVQVTKEERGNKGAALTTYLSLAGRYCVLMPNTDRGGGISRRITSVADRKRLKSIVDDLDPPEGMAVIVRTAGMERQRSEIKRDFEYLLRLWDEIRETTLRSTAPALIYEEASLIKRSIRDLYTRDIGDIMVAGVEAYKSARSFMRMLAPAHAKRVQFYRDPSLPLFQRYQIESQIAAIHHPVVTLRSGGYIVINQTEALVAVDVNSGRATRERNIEETALRTNLEAADEVARQLRLRDLAGLIVIDFIDMDEGRNNAAVERRMKDALRNDRARIQIGRISSFGLLEMSRQRLHASLQEASTEICQHCHGSGRVRSVDSTALHVLRMVEEDITRHPTPGVTVHVPAAVALFILNQKRQALAQLELRRGVRIYLTADDSLTPPDYRLERIKQLAPGEELPPAPLPAVIDVDFDDDADEEILEEAEEIDATAAEAADETESGEEEGSDRGQGRGKRRRRRRGRGGRLQADDFTEQPGATGEVDGGEEESDADARAGSGEAEGEAPRGRSQRAEQGQSEVESEDGEDDDDGADTAATEGEETRRRRRRGRRGGRRRSRRGQDEMAAEGQAPAGADGEAAASRVAGDGEQPDLPADAAALPPQWRSTPTDGVAADAASDTAPSVAVTQGEDAVATAAADEKPRRTRRPRRPREETADLPEADEAVAATPEPALAAAPASSAPPATPELQTEAAGGQADDQPKKRGWWRRLME